MRMNIVLCGSSFPDVANYLRDALPNDLDANIIVWDGSTASLPTRCDVMIPMMHPITASLIDTAKPQLIQQWGSGLEGVDIAHAESKGAIVANVAASGGNADSVAEHAILLTLALLRHLRDAEQNAREGRWGSPVGANLAGRRVCVYGLGAVALPLCKRLKAFDVKLIGLSRNPNDAKVAAYELEKCYSVCEIEECLSDADILIVCVRQSRDNANAITERELRALPRGAIVIDIARGGLIDYAGLMSCLSDGHLGGAGLDVFWKEPFDPADPILRLANVVATPHVAGITVSGMRDIAKGVAANIVRCANGQPISNQVLANMSITEPSHLTPCR
jgi:phosphoglycerate dehydrogenase-like enzyme